MNNAKFEQLMNSRPNLEFKGLPPQFCLRDLVLFYYNHYYESKLANELAKAYVAKLWENVS